MSPPLAVVRCWDISFPPYKSEGFAARRPQEGVFWVDKGDFGGGASRSHERWRIFGRGGANPA